MTAVRVLCTWREHPPLRTSLPPLERAVFRRRDAKCVVDAVALFWTGWEIGAFCREHRWEGFSSVGDSRLREDERRRSTPGA
jgi:hypothetical protein